MLYSLTSLDELHRKCVISSESRDLFLMDAVHTIVYVSNEIWDEFFITPSNLIAHYDVKKCLTTSDCGLAPIIVENDIIGDNPTRSCSCISISNSLFLQHGFMFHRSKVRGSQEKSFIFKQCFKMQMSGYVLSMFVRYLKLSEFYRSSVISYLINYRNSPHNKSAECYPCKLVVQLNTPKKDVIDYKWNDRMVTLALETRELYHAMSWLSTLGGAFSALGDEFDHCALVAGRISIQQLKLGLRLGDPITVARCKLYVALSLLQRGYLKEARCIIKKQYSFATTPPVIDIRLIRMCQGIWAKLKYMYQLKKVKQKYLS